MIVVGLDLGGTQDFGRIDGKAVRSLLDLNTEFG